MKWDEARLSLLADGEDFPLLAHGNPVDFSILQGPSGLFDLCDMRRNAFIAEEVSFDFVDAYLTEQGVNDEAWANYEHQVAVYELEEQDACIRLAQAARRREMDEAVRGQEVQI